MLNVKQESFAQSYALNSNATAAAKAAGYSETSAYNQGFRLLQNEKVRERIEDLEKETFTTVNVVAELEDLVASGTDTTKLKALEQLAKARGNLSDDGPAKDKAGLHADIVIALNIIGEDETLLLIQDCDWYALEDEEEE
jgi:phage terminase small subunit